VGRKGGHLREERCSSQRETEPSVVAEASREPNSGGAQMALRMGAAWAGHCAEGWACGGSQTCSVPEVRATARRPEEFQAVCDAADGNTSMVLGSAGVVAESVAIIAQQARLGRGDGEKGRATQERKQKRREEKRPHGGTKEGVLHRE
jgi:hypothetical protein